MVTTSEAYAPAAAPDVEGTRLRSVRDWIAANARQLAVVALPPVAVSSFLLGATSEHLIYPRGASVYWTYLVVAPVLVGLAVVAGIAAVWIRQIVRASCRERVWLTV